MKQSKQGTFIPLASLFVAVLACIGTYLALPQIQKLLPWDETPQFTDTQEPMSSSSILPTLNEIKTSITTTEFPNEKSRVLTEEVNLASTLTPDLSVSEETVTPTDDVGNNPTEQVTLIIGSTVSPNGNGDDGSIDQMNGLLLWIDQINRAGGIKLNDDRVVIFDSKFLEERPYEGSINQLFLSLIVDHNANFLFSPYSPDLTDKVAVIAEQYGRIMLVPGHANDSTFQKGYVNIYNCDISSPLDTVNLTNITPEFGPTVSDFNTAYKEAYGGEPTYQAAGGFIAGLVLQYAIEASGSSNIKSVRGVLNDMDLLTFAGRIKFDSSAENHGMQIGH